MTDHCRRLARLPCPTHLHLLKTRRSIKPIELDRPRPDGGRDRDAADRRVARARSRQAHAVALHRVRGRGATRGRRGDRRAPSRPKYPDAKPEQVEAERSRLARAPLVIAVVSRAGTACEDSGMGAGALRRRRRDEPGHRRACARLRARTGSPNGTPMTARVLDALGLQPNERIAGFVHIGRPASRRRTGRARRSPRS